MATLRHWEAVGLLEPPPRQGGKRLFPETVLARIAIIDLARRTGFRLQEVRQLLQLGQGSDGPGGGWRAVAPGKLAELDQMLAAVEAMRRLLGHLAGCQCDTLEACVAMAAACSTPPTACGPLNRERARRPDHGQPTSTTRGGRVPVAELDRRGPAANFGGLLRAYRERALLSQEQLAERAGLSARTIRELEAGRVKRPRGSSVRLLAQALGLQGSLRQAFAAAARTHPAAWSGDAVTQDRGDGGSPSSMAGGVLARPTPSAVGGVERPGVLVLSLSDGLTIPSRALSPPDAMPEQAVGRLAGRGGWPRGPRVIVVAVAIELVGRAGHVEGG